MKKIMDERKKEQERRKKQEKKEGGDAKSGKGYDKPEKKEEKQADDDFICVADKSASLCDVIEKKFTEEEATLFIDNIFKLALSIETLFPDGKIPNLRCQHPGVISLSRQKVACLLSHAFFGTYFFSLDIFSFEFLTLSSLHPELMVFTTVYFVTSCIISMQKSLAIH